MKNEKTTCGTLVAYPRDTYITRKLQRETNSRTDDDQAKKKDKKKTFVISTWNVKGIQHKTGELEEELKERKIDTAVLTETKRNRKEVKT